MRFLDTNTIENEVYGLQQPHLHQLLNSLKQFDGTWKPEALSTIQLLNELSIARPEWNMTEEQLMDRQVLRAFSDFRTLFERRHLSTQHHRDQFKRVGSFAMATNTWYNASFQIKNFELSLKDDRIELVWDFVIPHGKPTSSKALAQFEFEIWRNGQHLVTVKELGYQDYDIMADITYDYQIRVGNVGNLVMCRCQKPIKVDYSIFDQVEEARRNREVARQERQRALDERSHPYASSVSSPPPPPPHDPASYSHPPPSHAHTHFPPQIIPPQHHQHHQYQQYQHSSSGSSGSSGGDSDHHSHHHHHHEESPMHYAEAERLKRNSDSAGCNSFNDRHDGNNHDNRINFSNRDSDSDSNNSKSRLHPRLSTERMEQIKDKPEPKPEPTPEPKQEPKPKPKPEPEPKKLSVAIVNFRFMDQSFMTDLIARFKKLHINLDITTYSDLQILDEKPQRQKVDVILHVDCVFSSAPNLFDFEKRMNELKSCTSTNSVIHVVVVNMRVRRGDYVYWGIQKSHFTSGVHLSSGGDDREQRAVVYLAVFKKMDSEFLCLDLEQFSEKNEEQLATLDKLLQSIAQ